MEINPEGFDLREALRCLGWNGGPIPEELLTSVRQTAARLQKLCHPRAVFRLFDTLPPDTAAPVTGNAVLFAATLGLEFERFARTESLRDPAAALIADACGSALIEAVCDSVEDHARSLVGKPFSRRISPGYGAWSLEAQPALLHLLDAERAIGITLTEGCMMLPQKSVTGLVLFSDTPIPNVPNSCAGCAARTDCKYRKAGMFCGKTDPA